jgi:hypothetical protein
MKKKILNICFVLLFVVGMFQQAHAEDKWNGYVEFLAKPGTARHLGQSDLLIPLWQDKNDLTFFNGRGMFDNKSNNEFNLGIGHRHLFSDNIAGAYLFYDNRNTETGNNYYQVTGGAELLTENWDFRVNGYIPENKIATKTNNEVLKTTVKDLKSKANLNTLTADLSYMRMDEIKTTTKSEKALPGLDAEIGFRLPFEKLIKSDGLLNEWAQDVRIYGAGYHFAGSDGFDSITGVRGRVEARLFDLPLLGPGSRLMGGYEIQHDEHRGTQSFGLVSLRIPFGALGKRLKKQPKLHGLARRMQEPIIRDVDIISTANMHVVDEVVETLIESQKSPMYNWQGRAFTAKKDVDTFQEANTELDKIFTANDSAIPLIMISDNQNHKLNPDIKDGSLIVFGTDSSGNPTVVDRNNSNNPVTFGETIIRKNTTYSAAGTEFKYGVRFNPQGLIVEVVHNAGKTAPTLLFSQGNFIMKDGSHINGFHLNNSPIAKYVTTAPNDDGSFNWDLSFGGIDTGHTYTRSGRFDVPDTKIGVKGKYKISNSSIREASSGIGVHGGSAMTLENVTIQGSRDNSRNVGERWSAVLMNEGGTLRAKNVIFTETDYGIYYDSGSTNAESFSLIADGLRIQKASVGIYATATRNNNIADLRIDRSSFTDVDIGLDLVGKATATLSSVLFRGINEIAIRGIAHGKGAGTLTGSVTIKNSQFGGSGEYVFFNDPEFEFNVTNSTFHARADRTSYFKNSDSENISQARNRDLAADGSLGRQINIINYVNRGQIEPQ